jgi:hypothetical protein
MKKFPYMRAINARLADVSETTSKLSLQEKQSLLSSLELDVAVIESFICRPRKTRRHTCFIIDTNTPPAPAALRLQSSCRRPCTSTACRLSFIPSASRHHSRLSRRSVTKTKTWFIVTLTAPNGGAIAEGVLSILAIG